MEKLFLKFVLNCLIAYYFLLSVVLDYFLTFFLDVLDKLLFSALDHCKCIF